jgi:hypothetical protein
VLGPGDKILGFDISYAMSSGPDNNVGLNIGSQGDSLILNTTSGYNYSFGSESNTTPGTWVKAPELDPSRGIAELALLIGFVTVLRGRRT